MTKNTIGVICDDRRGVKLASGIAGKGFSTAVYMTGFNTLTGEEQEVVHDAASASGIMLIPELDSFIDALEVPRKIFMFSLDREFNAKYLKQVLDMLDSGDALVNLCDMNYIQAGSIVEDQWSRGVYYLPTGFSRGEISEEAGLSIMPGGVYESYDAMRSVFMEIAARDEGGFVCAPYIGPAGSGQYVKMVINGLEYALLEINAEMISLINLFCAPDNDETVELLYEINSTESQSYFLEMFTDIYSRKDSETGVPVTEVVSDQVDYGQSVVWCCDEGFKLGMPLSVIGASLELRFLSNMKGERIASSRLIDAIPQVPVNPADMREFVEDLRRAAYLAGLCALAQCFGLLRTASERYSWDLDLLAIARTMQVNSYTRSRSINRVIEAYDRHNKLVNLLTDPYFRKCASNYAPCLRSTVIRAQSAGAAIPALSAALQYIDMYRTPKLGSGIIQLSRDYVNGTGYERSDYPGIYHGNWDDHEEMLTQSRAEQ
ncbi:MAG: hypothetical protein IJM24_02765 [Clostridia bacterium]|nr:hypothetical protein [Clostridia bacterium]MBR7062531.1 hypothetical protein [Clostridia bacterium]